jgi:hypothetical protein
MSAFHRHIVGVQSGYGRGIVPKGRWQDSDAIVKLLAMPARFWDTLEIFAIQVTMPVSKRPHKILFLKDPDQKHLLDILGINQ